MRTPCFKYMPRKVTNADDTVSQFIARKRVDIDIAYEPTVVLLDERLVDNIMVVHVHVDFVILHIQIDRVQHGDVTMIVSWRPGAPVLPQVSEHGNVVPEKEKSSLSQRDGKRPLSFAIPLQRGRELTAKLRSKPSDRFAQ